MGLGELWLGENTSAAVMSAHMPTLIAGTQPAGYLPPFQPTGRSQPGAPAFAGGFRVRSKAEVLAMAEGTTLPGCLGPHVPYLYLYLMETPQPSFEFVISRDEYGVVLVRRVDPTNPVAIAEPALASGHALAMAEAPPQARVVENIRILSGFSWPRIAHLVGVERQTIYRWRRGEPADQQKLQRAFEVLDILREAQEEHGTGSDLRAWLNRVAPLQDASPYQLLSEGRYEEARFLAMLAPSRVTRISGIARDTSRWERHFTEEERSYRG